MHTIFNFLFTIVRYMYVKRKQFSIVFVLTLFNCEGEIGEMGIVVNFNTGYRIEDVEVKMESDKESTVSLTDSLGYFNSFQIVGCGLGNCDDDFTITFEKEGFESFSIDESYSNSEFAEYLTEARDTLVIRIMPL